MDQQSLRVRSGYLFYNIATKRVEKRYCAFSRSLIKPVLQQIRLLQVVLQIGTKLLLRVLPAQDKLVLQQLT